MAKRMATQMELFEPVERGFNEGGLMDEGGMVDEQSGNEVPPGSLREEVRDDIPAQLSEGEFVFPADVVRYVGLENLMRMRQEAKQGLSQMEAMGQMGNSEEATVEDDLPFDMYDLDIDDEGEYNSETRNFQVGGFVSPFGQQQPYQQPTQVNPQTGTYTLPGTGIAGYQVPSGGQTGYTPYGGAQPYFQPVQFTGPQYQTALQTTNLPTFAETVGSKPGQYDELRTYQNDAGQTLQIPFKDGKPIYPIPEGYRPIGDQPAPEEAPTTVTPTMGQTQVRDGGGRDDDSGYSGATVALGGVSGTGVEEGLRVGDFDVVGVSYNMPSLGLGKIPGVVGGLAKMGSFLSSGLPETSTDIAPGQPGYNPGGTATFFDRNNPSAGVVVTAEDFNNMKNTDFKGALAESYKSAVRAVSAVKAGDIDAYNNLSTDRLGPSGKSAKDLADAATVKGLLDKVDISNPQGLIDNIKNAFTGTFAESVDKLNDAERAVLEGMGVDLDGKTFGKSADELDDTIGYGRGKPSAVFDDPDDFDDDSPSAPADAGTPPEAAFGAGKSNDDSGRSSQGFGGTDSPSGGPGCFAAGTKFFMQDGSLKSVEDIKVGDFMMDGGKVRLSIVGDGSKSDWYMYGTTKVTGTHPVREQGVWKFIRDAENAVPTETEDLLYTLTNEKHRVVAEDKVVYSDYDMVDEDGIEEELLEMMNLQEVVEEAA